MRKILQKLLLGLGLVSIGLAATENKDDKAFPAQWVAGTTLPADMAQAWATLQAWEKGAAKVQRP